MGNVKSLIFAPKRISNKDRDVAYQYITSSISESYRIYVDRFLLDKEMEKIWELFEKKRVSSEMQFLLFWNILSTIRKWANHDNRSDNQKMQAIGEIVYMAKRLNNLLADPNNNLFFVEHSFPRTLKEVNEKEKRDKEDCVKYQDSETLKILFENLISIAARGRRILKNGNVPNYQNVTFKVPKQKNRKTAFRNLLIDHMCLFYGDKYKERPKGLTTKVIAEIAGIISGNRTEEDDVKDRIKQLRKQSLSKNVT